MNKHQTLPLQSFLFKRDTILKSAAKQYHLNPILMSFTENNVIWPIQSQRGQKQEMLLPPFLFR